MAQNSVITSACKRKLWHRLREFFLKFLIPYTLLVRQRRTQSEETYYWYGKKYTNELELIEQLVVLRTEQFP